MKTLDWIAAVPDANQRAALLERALGSKCNLTRDIIVTTLMRNAPLEARKWLQPRPSRFVRSGEVRGWKGK